VANARVRSFQSGTLSQGAEGLPSLVPPHCTRCVPGVVEGVHAAVKHTPLALAERLMDERTSRT
jgi:hypothetical protein